MNLRFVLIGLLVFLGAWPWLLAKEPNRLPIGLSAIVGGVSEASPKVKSLLPDPFPIQRWLIDADGMESPKVRAAGPLVRMSVTQFEELVQKAAESSSRQSQETNIIQAHYTAKYENHQLSGSGVWHFAKSVSVPRWVSLEPLRVAVSRPRWQDGRPGRLVHTMIAGREIAESALQIEKNSDTQLSLDWSARSEDSPDEERFELSFPVSSLAKLDLIVPNNRRPRTPQAEVFLSGPYPADVAGHQLWRFIFNARSRLDLSLFENQPVQPTPLPQIRRQVRISLTPGEVRSTFDFRLSSPRNLSVVQQFLVPPDLQIVDVTGSNPVRWTYARADNPQLPGKLTIDLQDALANTRIVINTIAPLPTQTNRWTPSLIQHPAGCLGGDRLEFRLHPDLQFDGWTPSEYRLLSAEQQSDLWYQLSFTGTWTDGRNPERNPPKLHWSMPNLQFRSEETWDWQITPINERLSGSVKIQLQRGPCSSFVIRGTPGYELVAVSSFPEDPVQVWSWQQMPNQQWRLDASREIATGQRIELRLDFRSPLRTIQTEPSLGDISAIPLDFPNIDFDGVIERQGTLRIATDLRSRLNVESTAILEKSKLIPGFVNVPFRGLWPKGVVQYWPAPARLSLDQIEYQRDHLQSQVRLTGRCEDARTSQLWVVTPGADTTVAVEDPKIQVARIAPINLLPFLGSTSGWSALGHTAWLSPGPAYVWLVQNPDPWLDEWQIQVQQLPGSQFSPMLPWPTVLGANVDKVRLRLGEGIAPELRLDRDLFLNVLRQTPAWYNPDTNRQNSAFPDGPWLIDQVVQEFAIDAEGQLNLTLTGMIRQKAQSRLPVQLSPGGRLLSVKVAGKWLPGFHANQTDLELPLPMQDSVPFTIQVQYPRPSRQPFFRVLAPTIVLPDQIPIRQQWTFDPHWRPWPSLAITQPDDSNIWIFPSRWLDILSLIFASLMLGAGVGLLVSRFRRWAWRIYTVGIIALAALAGLMNPDWFVLWRNPLAVGAIILTMGLMQHIWRQSNRRTTQASTSSLDSVRRLTVPVMVLLLGLSSGSLAQAPSTEPVFFLVSDKEASPQKALVPKTLLARLEQQPRKAEPSVLITQASYRGELVENSVTWTADYQLELMEDRPQTVLFRLAGVRLEEMTLNGKNAFPTASAKPEGYVLQIPGRGPHQVQARFTVPINANGADRVVQWQVPDVPATQVSFRTSSKIQFPDIRSRRGGQLIEQSKDEIQLLADHGGGGTIAIHWRENLSQGLPARMTVREASVWKVNETESSLTAAYQYRIESGTVTRVTFDWPVELALGQITVRSAENRPNFRVGLRNWEMENPDGAKPKLHLDFQSAIDGKILVILTGYPKKLLNRRPVLPTIAPSGQQVADADRDAFAVLAFNDIDVEEINLGGAIDFPADTFFKDFATIPELDLRDAPTVRVVRRLSGQKPVFRPVFRKPAFQNAVNSQLNCVLGEEVRWEGILQSPTWETGCIEFTLPNAIRLVEVSGPQVAGWSRQGQRVQVWAVQPNMEMLIRWVGETSQKAASPRQLQNWKIALPQFSYPSTTPIQIQFRAAAGWKITRSQLASLQLLQPSESWEDRIYQTEQGGQVVAFQVEPLPNQPPIPRTFWPLKSTPPLKPSNSSAQVTTDTDLAPREVTQPTAFHSAWRTEHSWVVLGHTLCAILLAFMVHRGSRWTPEIFFLLGMLSILILGINSSWSIPFWFVVGFGILYRMVWLFRHLARLVLR